MLSVRISALITIVIASNTSDGRPPDATSLMERYSNWESTAEKWELLQQAAQDEQCWRPEDSFQPWSYYYSTNNNSEQHKEWILQTDPLMYYLSSANKGDYYHDSVETQIRTILIYFTDKDQFIQTHFAKGNDGYPTYQSQDILTGKKYNDPLLIWCARFNHLFIIEWLLNIEHPQIQQNINYNLLEINHSETLLQVLSRYAVFPRYRNLILTLLYETDIEMIPEIDTPEMKNLQYLIREEFGRRIFASRHQIEKELILLENIIDINDLLFIVCSYPFSLFFPVFYTKYFSKLFTDEYLSQK